MYGMVRFVHQDLQDGTYQIHLNAWVKEHGIERGFAAHNYKRYGYKSARGLERWLDRNRNNKQLKDNTSTRSRPIQSVITSNQGDVQQLTDFEIYHIPYGDIEPTKHISSLNHDDWIDKYIRYDYFTDDPILIKEIQQQWRTEYLTETRNRLWEEEELLVLEPRGYGKTETVLALYVRWFLEVFLPLYIVAPAYNHNKTILRRMALMIKSPAIRRDYGDIINAVSFDREMLTITYHPDIEYLTLDAPVSMVTWQSAKEGVHPAWLVFDDVMQKEFKNIESNEDIKWKWSKTFSKMRTRRMGVRTRVSVIGTRYGIEDMYSFFMNIQKFKVLHHRALNEDGTWLYCPNYTLEDLLKERAIPGGVAAFETSMNNNPIPSTGIYFSADSWKETEDNPLLHQQGIQYYCAIDPARGISDSADNTAIIVFAIHQGKGYVVDGYVGHANTDKLMKEYDHFYSTYHLTWTLVEKTFAQIDLNRFNKYRGITPYTDTVKRAKLMRIDAMRGYFTDGLITVFKQDSVKDKEMGKPYQFIYREYLSYNSTDSTPSRKDDAIDALSMIIQHAGQYLEKYVETQYDYSEIDSFHLKVNG